MSDIAKWAILAAGIIALIAIVMNLPIVQAIDTAQIAGVLSQFLSVVTPYITFARGLINFMVLPQVIPMIDIVMVWVFCKPLLTFVPMITKAVYKWILK